MQLVSNRPPDHRSHLHPQPTRLLGRESECATVQQVLLTDDIRLVNLTGPAGVGKTRLAIEVGTAIGSQFAEGVCFIDMTPVRDPALVSSSLAHGVGLQDTEGGSLRERLERYLRERHTLLILDNFEQVTAGAPQLADFLGCCPRIKFLVTSREPLHLLWEHAIPVAPLPLPNLQPLPAQEVLGQVASVALFLDRAGAINPGFVLSADNARTVAELCVHLDGLPLALELAAARAKLLSPQMMLDRLQDRFSLLRWRAQDLPERQHTLNAAIAWSYDLLGEGEQRLFRHVGVFEGGFTLEATEALEAQMPSDRAPDRVWDTRTGSMAAASVLDGMTSLVDKSLVIADPETEDGVRYRMLEGIREYALGQLGGHGEDDVTRRAHAASFLTLAEAAEPELRGREQLAWFTRLEREHENMRAAQRWLTARGESEHALRLATSLAYFWWTRGYLAEGRRHLEDALARAQDVRPELRARALNALAINLLSQGESNLPRLILEEARLLATSADDRGLVAHCLANLGLDAQRRGEWGESRRLLTEAQARWEDLADSSGTAYALVHLGITALFAGDAVGAERLLAEAEARYRALGDVRNTVQTGVWLGYLAGARGDMARAAGNLIPSIELSMQAHDPRLFYHCATLVIWLSAGRGSAELLIRLVGAQDALRTRTGFMPSAWIQGQLATATATARSRLAPEAFEAQRIEGQVLSFPKMAELALRVLETGAKAAAEFDKARGKSRPHRILSEREEEVLRLVAQGLSNKAIAHELIIAPSTVSYYITSTFNKLGVNTRAQAVAEAARRELL